jgi:cold shock CspA family protein
VRGRVTAFDEHRGLGELTADDGRVLPFHCTAIADGTRTIRVGSQVEFEIMAGHRGHWEATSLVLATHGDDSVA